ncbi:MAG: hypothetical protein WCX08_00640 [Candidatus Buchananbacteria bacterium]
MEIKKQFSKWSSFLKSVMVVLIASLFVMTVVYAATTIGSSITVGSGDITLTSGNLSVGGSATTTSLYASNDLTVIGNASSTGGLYTQGAVSAGGSLTVGSYIKAGGTIFDLSTSSAPTTTPGIFSRDRTSSTSTVSIGDINDGSAAPVTNGCLELAASNGAYYNCYIDVATPSLVCSAGRCN